MLQVLKYAGASDVMFTPLKPDLFMESVEEVVQLLEVNLNDVVNHLLYHRCLAWIIDLQDDQYLGTEKDFPAALQVQVYGVMHNVS